MILVPILFYLDDIKWHPVIFHFAFQDVMVVGEPSLMGGDFGEEDERLITRLENTQYDPAGHPVPPLEDPSAPYSGPGGGLTPSWTTPSGTSGPSQEMELKRSPPNS